MAPLARFHQRIREKADDAWAAPVLIVAFGDSVTQGMTEGDEPLHEAVYHARFTRLLEAQYPRTTFSVINAGVSGQTAGGALALLERDVIRHQPDLTVIGFALNDAWNGLEGLASFVETLSEIVRQVRERTESDVILLTPNFMNRRVATDVAPALGDLLRATAAMQNDGVLGAYAQAVRDVARTHDVPCADVYAAWQARAEQGEDVDAMLANGMNHPTAAAHAVPAELLTGVVTATA